jgi:hypothetical protein
MVTLRPDEMEGITPAEKKARFLAEEKTPLAAM